MSIYSLTLVMPTCEVLEQPIITEHYCGQIVTNIVFVRKSVAKNNFMKHCENNDAKKVKAMIKRGSLISINTVNSDTANINKSAK